MKLTHKSLGLILLLTLFFSSCRENSFDKIQKFEMKNISTANPFLDSLLNKSIDSVDCSGRFIENSVDSSISLQTKFKFRLLNNNILQDESIKQYIFKDIYRCLSANISELPIQDSLYNHFKRHPEFIDTLISVSKRNNFSNCNISLISRLIENDTTLKLKIRASPTYTFFDKDKFEILKLEGEEFKEISEEQNFENTTIIKKYKKNLNAFKKDIFKKIERNKVEIHWTISAD